MESKIKRLDIYQHRRHNKNLLLVHLIFVTKYRKQILCHNLKDDIKQWLFETAGKYNWYIKKMETDMDHVHILLQYRPTDCITDIVSRLKQYSTYHAWIKYGGMLSGYYQEGVGKLPLVTVCR